MGATPYQTLTAREAEATEDGWRSRAECRDANPEIFHPRSNTGPGEALSWCVRCPVSAECLEFVLAVEAVTRIRHGVYGGMTEGERHNLARNRRRRSRKVAP